MPIRLSRHLKLIIPCTYDRFIQAISTLAQAGVQDRPWCIVMDPGLQGCTTLNGIRKMRMIVIQGAAEILYPQGLSVLDTGPGPA